ncbi:YkgJ family cysteine cluster protein [Nannocystis sp. SCPEA4]|uniref:YkgJ family cysteine cluster protein n=1 Tax=Nannocystis sp. SCPEA4 TaxID=2996787 RepID=UPI00226F0EE2|nr:YkgJ family cysteine cluster protein [Nannocystis sp. SCPEA4]
MSDPDRPALAAILVQLRSRVDAHFAAAQARTPAAFACRSGCDTCCHQRFGVFAAEAEPIRRALADLSVRTPVLRARIREQADDPAHQHHCALLVDGACAVYGERPLICRSHGLPIAVADPAPRVDHCPLNFTSGPPPRESVLRLDAVNQPLAVLATLWDRADGEGDRPPARIALADLAREPDPARTP